MSKGFKIRQVPNPTMNQGSQYITLLEVTRALASHTTIDSLMRDLNQRLHHVLHFNYLSLLLYDREHEMMRIHNLESSVPSSLAPGLLIPMENSSAAQVWKTQEPLVVPDVAAETRFVRTKQIMEEHGARSFCILPLTTPRRRLGTITLGSAETRAYDPDHLELPSLVADQVAIAVENALNLQEAQEAQQQLTRERDRLRLLLDTTSTAVSNLGIKELFWTIPKSVRSAMQCDAACISLPDPDQEHLRIHGLDFPSSNGAIHEELVLPIQGTTPGAAFRSGEPRYYGRLPANLHPSVHSITVAERIQSGCFLPIIRDGHKMGVLHLLDRRPDFFHHDDVGFLRQLATQIAIALENALQFSEVAEARIKLQEEARYLRQELRSESGFGESLREILGESAAIRRALNQIQTVAPTDSTVLIQGETGTGKELVARAIHNLSNRRDHPFIKINCAAIPLGLLESELFGHERGAFTGAIAQKTGRFELANKGTLFLDEIGDIPLELQSKLLRVLQEQEFERLGSNRTIRVNVRVVAATNRDLARMVEEREFRADLYYRLNVFPIVLAPLRERREDIPLLVHHFAAKFAHRMNKRIDTIPVEAVRILSEYSWPGNIRELQNFIERAVILTAGHTLNAPLGELRAAQLSSDLTAQNTKLPAFTGDPRTLEDAERDHILRALDATGWKLSGANGTAARLGVPRTTLLYRLKRLGIERKK